MEPFPGVPMYYRVPVMDCCHNLISRLMRVEFHKKIFSLPFYLLVVFYALLWLTSYKNWSDSKISESRSRKPQMQYSLWNHQTLRLMKRSSARQIYRQRISRTISRRVDDRLKIQTHLGDEEEDSEIDIEMERGGETRRDSHRLFKDRSSRRAAQRRSRGELRKGQSPWGTVTDSQ